MSAVPVGIILEAVNNGEATLPGLKRATGFDYPVLLTALEGPLAGAVRKEETATGFLRFHPLGSAPEHKVVQLPVGPFCIKCRVECRKTHQAGKEFVGGEARWMCPECKERFPGTHAKRNVMARIEAETDPHAAARERISEIIANGQRPSRVCPQCGGKKSAGTEMCRKCFEDQSKNGRHKKKTVAKAMCAECGKKEAEGGTLCWDCDAAKIEAGLAEVEVLAPEETPEESPVGDAPAPSLSGLILYDSVQDCVNEVVNWPKERLAEFFATMAEVMGLSQHSPRTEIKLAWSRSFEENDPEGTTGLTYLYLISMLHHRMEEHEKQAVWILVQYLKRIECANEEREALREVNSE